MMMDSNEKAKTEIIYYYVNYDHVVNVFKYRLHTILDIELEKESFQRSYENPSYVLRMIENECSFSPHV